VTINTDAAEGDRAAVVSGKPTVLSDRRAHRDLAPRLE
jgi:hypothetical protein